MACWFWNIERKYGDYFSQELSEGRLRQGWSYKAKLDLRLLRNKLDSGQPLDEEEATAWNRCHYMLQTTPGAMRDGDLVAVKNVPDGEHFTIVRVCGPYEFRLDSPHNDFGHVRAVECLREFNRNAAAVPLPFARALARGQYPIRATHTRADTVAWLFGLPADTRTADAETQKERLDRIRSELSSHLRSQLRDQLQRVIDPNFAEYLILKMLKADGMTATPNGGPNERGADILAERDLGHGLSAKIGIQVKFHLDVDDDLRSLEQLEQAFKEHALDAALLVSFADTLGPHVAAKLEVMQRTLSIQALYGAELFGRLLDFFTEGPEGAD